MPHPQSPHRPSSTEVSGGFGSFLPPKDPFCAPVPLHSPVPLSSASPRPSVISTTMTTAYPESATSKEARLPPSLTGFDDATAFQWSNCGVQMSRLGQEGVGYSLPSHYGQETAGPFDYSPNSLPYNENYNINYSAHNLGASCPRSYTNGLDLSSLPSNISMSESYPPSAYQIEPPKPQDVMDLSEQGISDQLLQLSDDYEHQYATNIKVEGCIGYDSPYASDTTRCSTPFDDPPMPLHDAKNECGGEGEPIDKEQPYAQLIYRALLEAPGKTMILRDIYNWFKENTDKAADKETKGWQNSIRHNLSMNGAFEKVDHPCEDAKKGFMWRLTDEAVREGVKSTTRYRSKQPNKRGNRSQNPLPQRQASGAKGGQAARRLAKMRRTNRMHEAYRSEPYMSRSVPISYDPQFDARSTDSNFLQHNSPYYGSPADTGYGSMQDEFGGPLGAPSLDLLPTRSYSASPLSQSSCHDSAYVLYQDPSQPLFCSSPSPPSEDGPPTPPSEPTDYFMGMYDLPGGTQIFDENTTTEYHHEMMQ